MNFNDCHLIEPIIRALEEQGYTEPTAIQAGAIPPALEGRDVLGCARTGTGKTCAFAAPILQRLNETKAEGRPIRALVLTPTRELAIQNQECFEAYGKYLPLRSVVIFGGVGQNPQVEAIHKGADILVATPGRLADLHQQGEIDLSRLEIFVLDEADRMLDMGFIHDVKKILKWLPRRKQTLFFSATMPKEITELVNSLLHHPVRVAVDPVNTAVDLIEQKVYKVDRVNKTKLLVSLLEREPELTSVLVFTRTKHGANKVSRDLTRAGVSSAAIHGNKSQTARQEALADFKAGKLRVLVATDIAARGLDIEELSCVVNYNLPEVPETYIHRIGRTGRAGHGGIAIALCDYQELPLLKEIEKLMKKKVPEVEGHPWPMENFEEVKRDKHGKVRNPEDEEAREAARERARERRAAEAEKAAPSPDAAEQGEPAPSKKKRGKKHKKQDEPQEGGTPAAESAPAPKKAAKKGKKPAGEESVGVVPIPDLLPDRTELPAEPERHFDSNDILHRKYKRPERKVIPSLSSVSLLPTMELKETFGSRSELLQTHLEQSPGKLPKGDATARMFSQRTRLPEQLRQGKQSTDGKGKKARKKGREQSAAEEPKQAKKAPEQSALRSDGKRQFDDKRHFTDKRSSSAGKKQPQAKKQADAGKKQEQRVVFTVADGERPARPNRAARRKKASEQRKQVRIVPARPEPAARQKDSTEQESLMKPYYLSDVKK